MSFELGALIAFVCSIIAGAVAYGRMSRSVDANESAIVKNKEEQDEENQNIWKVIGDCRKKMEEHYEESGKVRLQIEKDLGTIRETAVKGDGRFETIMLQLEDIKKKIDKLEASKS